MTAEWEEVGACAFERVCVCVRTLFVPVQADVSELSDI